MKKTYYLMIASLVVLLFSFGSALAEDNVGDGEFVARGIAQADVGGDAVATISLTFTNHYTAYAIKVDWDRTFRTFYCRLSDLAISGDSYYASFGRRAGAKVVTTTNQTASGTPYAPGVWSSYASVYGKNTTIWVTPGKMTGGLPAGMQVELNLPGSGFTYKIYKY